jgi:hypothetical protein
MYVIGTVSGFNFMKIYTDVKAILRLRFRNLKGSSVGISDGGGGIYDVRC